MEGMNPCQEQKEFKARRGCFIMDVPRRTENIIAKIIIHIGGRELFFVNVKCRKKECVIFKYGNIEYWFKKP